MTAFTDFVNLELPKRGAVLLSGELGFVGDPNTAVDAALNNAPQGRTYYWDATNSLLWHKRGPTSTDWVDATLGGTAAPLSVPTHAALALIVPASLTVGAEYTVATDGTKWTYTGSEAGAPDPTAEAAWEITGPALESWFSDPAFPTAGSRTAYIDSVAGSDVFNDGSAAQPWATGLRGMNQIPETFGKFIPTPSGSVVDAARYHLQCQGGAASKLNLADIDPKFARTTLLAVDFIGELSPVDLDGAGTTEFAAAVFNRDLTGPLLSGATVLKQSTYRLGIGVNVLASVQQPANDGDRFVYKEDDFGFPGLRFIGVANNCRVHDSGSVMGPQDIGVVGGAFGSGFTLGGTTILSDFVTQVSGNTGDFFPVFLATDSIGIDVTFTGLDFATDLIANAKRLPTMRGSFIFRACKFKVGNAQGIPTLNYKRTSGAGTSQMVACTIIGETGFNLNPIFAFAGESTTSENTLSENLFISAAMALGVGSWLPYMNVFRGVDPAEGNNGNGGRLVLGSEGLGTDRGGVISCIVNRCTNDFERAPGEASPMKTSAPVSQDFGAAIIAIGAGTAFTFGGSQGAGSVDVEGKFYLGVYGAQMISQNAYNGEVTRPMLLRTGSNAQENFYSGTTTTTMTGMVNATGTKAVPGGGDVQLGLLPGASVQAEIIKDWADLPATDIAHGEESEGVYWR